VPDALVRIEPDKDRSTSPSATVASTVTDEVGFFGRLVSGAMIYDLTARLGTDVIVYRGASGRSLDPSIEIDDSRKFPSAWTSHVDVKLDPPVTPGHAVALFANGDTVLGVTGDAVKGYELLSREFAGAGTLHAVEYESERGLVSAVGYGRADVVYTAAAAAFITIPIAPLDAKKDYASPSFSVTPPAGLPPPSSVDVIVSFSELSDAVLATLPLGASARIPLIPDCIYRYRTRATLGGALADSGEFQFDPHAPVTNVVLPTLPVPVSPDAISASDPLLATGDGVLEHVLTAEGGGPMIRIVVRDRAARLPDPTLMGLSPLRGTYTWTVRSLQNHLPGKELLYVEQVANPTAHRFNAVSASKPRSIKIN
jgi:hypothetical protein